MTDLSLTRNSVTGIMADLRNSNFASTSFAFRKQCTACSGAMYKPCGNTQMPYARVRCVGARPFDESCGTSIST